MIVKYGTMVTAKHILGTDLTALEGLRDNEDHPATVATQLSVIAWNRYEADALNKIMRKMGNSGALPADEHNEILRAAVRTEEYKNVLRSRGSLESVFDFVSRIGVYVTLREKIKEEEEE